MYWIILANTNSYRLYGFEHKTHQLSLLEEAFNPACKAKDSDLTSDRQGSYKARDSAHGAFSPDTDPKQNEIDHFLKSLADKLEKGRATNQFEHIILIASPEVNGTLSKHLNKHVASMLMNHIKKDHIHFSHEELSEFLQKNWKELTA